MTGCRSQPEPGRRERNVDWGPHALVGMRLGWTELDCLGLNIPALDRLFGALGGATFVYNSILPESNIELISSRVCRPAGAFSPNFLSFSLPFPLVNSFNYGS